MTEMLPNMLGTPTAVMSCKYNGIGPRHSTFVWKSDNMTFDAVSNLAWGKSSAPLHGKATAFSSTS